MRHAPHKAHRGTERWGIRMAVLAGAGLLALAAQATEVRITVRAGGKAVIDAVASLLSASAAFVISKEYGGINPFEAEFAGLISNIGAFYILYKAATYPPVSRDPIKVKRFINQHHEKAGLKILKHLDMPIDLMDAIETSPLHSVGIDRVPRSMREVVHIARSIADEKHPWRDIDNRPTIQGSLFGELEELIEYRRNENTAIYE